MTEKVKFICQSCGKEHVEEIEKGEIDDDLFRLVLDMFLCEECSSEVAKDFISLEE